MRATQGRLEVALGPLRATRGVFPGQGRTPLALPRPSFKDGGQGRRTGHAAKITKRKGDATATQNLIDTEIKLGVCNRCKAYVFACQVSGLATAADPQPLDVEQYRAALIAGRRTYDVIRQAGRPVRLRLRTASVPTSGCDIVAAHSCGAHGMDATTVTEVPQGPPGARASGTGHQGPPCASSTPHTGSSRAAASGATRPASDHRWTPGPLRCDTCRNLIADQEPYFGIECGTYRWAVHDSCP